jgi:hypothetical protein
VTRASPAALALVATLALPLPARADGEVWALAQLGVGYVRGPYHYEGDSLGLFAEPVRRLEFDVDLSSAVLDASGVLGWSFPFGLAVGLGGDVTLLNRLDAQVGSHTTIEMGHLAALSLVAGWHPNDDGFSLRAGVGTARAGFASETNDIGASDNIVDPEVVTGPIASLGAGWVWSSAGFGVRVAYAHLTADRSRFDPLLITAGGLFDFW